MIAILKIEPFSCGALYIELQNFLNYLLFIAALFNINNFL
ncbi:hypothetical protein HFP66_01850 [Bacillus sp. A17A.1]